jgi:hypothetical protein
MTPEDQARLRAPFEPGAVGKLPRVWCFKCREAIKAKRHNCDEHRKSRCRECDNSMTEAHLHLDYIGHAAVTDRLLQVDPSWSWEPVALGQDGLPVLDRNGGLWIRLTVAGVTRLGYGDAEGKQGGSAVKEAIGDALRNAAMRFGVALDLWHKGDLHADEGPQPIGSGQPAEPDLADTARLVLAKSCDDNGWDRDIVKNRFKAATGTDLRTATDADGIEEFRKSLFALSDGELRGTPATNGAAR